jgi:hypothetical protein
VKSDARPDQPVALTRCLLEAMPIQYRNLRSAARNQTCAFELSGNLRDSRPVHTQHFGEQILGDL